MTNYNQRIGETEAGIYLFHNGLKFTTYDKVNSINENCGSYYSQTPFWYFGCWSGSINGGGENEEYGFLMEHIGLVQKNIGELMKDWEQEMVGFL